MQGSSTFVSLDSGLESNEEEKKRMHGKGIYIGLRNPKPGRIEARNPKPKNSALPHRTLGPEPRTRSPTSPYS